ncbi:MAG: MMPL family transporter, partial [Methylococcales bacterium]|nr:MMPL family transporter [Methylococcales bacterium]
FDNPFNFANIIVLPLLLGLGVDSSIHIVHRLRLMKYEQSEILKTSTARGIFFSGLTTVFSFTSLAFISHAGTASLGLLLTIGILLTLTCTLVVLPAFAVKPEATFS